MTMTGARGSRSDTLAVAMEKPTILTARELRTIMPRLSGWKLAQNKLSRTFEFQDFVQSLSFVNSLVAYFETVDHHPDVRIAYGEVTFELTRYDLGGRVTDRDVEVAKKISSLYRARSCEPRNYRLRRFVNAALTSVNARFPPACRFTTAGAQDAALKSSGLAWDSSRVADVAGSASSSNRFVSRRRSVFFIKSRNCSGV